MKRTHPTILVSYSESPTSEDECGQGGGKGEPSPPNKMTKKIDISRPTTTTASGGGGGGSGDE